MKRQEVLKLMADGWELASTSGIRDDGRVSLQQGGQGRGGKVVTVSRTVLEAMLRRGEVVKAEVPQSRHRFCRTIYRLSTGDKCD